MDTFDHDVHDGGTEGWEGAEGTQGLGDGLESADLYTGVVVIQDMGIRARNETLNEAVNAVTRWFNAVAGLALRSYGPGRVWPVSQLTLDDNPDAPASRATIELSAPPWRISDSSASVASDVLRLEFREAWWGQSFSLPPLGVGFAWIGVQFRELLLFVLIQPIAPITSIALRALTARSDRSAGLRSQPAQRGGDVPFSDAGPRADSRLRRRRGTLLALLLVLYEVFQAAWKTLQWLLLTPLIYVTYVLLALLGLVRTVGLVPTVLLPLVNSIRVVSTYLSLHWMDLMRVYLNEYTRAAVMRQRFEREVDALLADAQCDRVIVLAHSMGAVVAYDGLTTLLTNPEQAHNLKPITFISLGQALHRAWRLTADDPGRLRGVLPEYVRWINLWARYDPLAAGPLTPRSLPPIRAWSDPVLPTPQLALAARLGQCENVDVVNVDSFLFDHTSYWENMEQVVGPLARELVAGHPALERAIGEHLATYDEVVLRRWNVAWQSMVALVAGGATAAAILVWDAQHNWTWGRAVSTLVFAQIPRLFNYIISLFVPFCSSGQTCSDRLGGLLGNLLSWAVGQGAVLPDIPLIVPTVLTSAGLAVTLMGVTNLVIARLSPSPSPVLRQARVVSLGRVRGILLLATSSLLLVALTSIFATSDVRSGASWSLSLAQVLGLCAWVLCLVDAAAGRRWGWCLAVALGAMMLSPKNPFQFTAPAAPTLYAHGKVAVIADLATSAALLGMVGMVILVLQLASARRWGWVLCLALVPPLLLVQTYPFMLEAARLNVPLLRQVMDASGSSGVLEYAAVSIGPLCPVLIYGCASSVRRQSSVLVGVLGLLLAVYLLLLANRALDVGWAEWLIGVATWITAVSREVAGRRWAWLTVTVLLLALSVLFTVPGVGVLTAALTFGLWGGQKATKYQPNSAPA